MKLVTLSSLFLILIFISGVNGQEKVNINYNLSAKGNLKFKGFVFNKIQSCGENIIVYVCSIFKDPKYDYKIPSPQP